MPACRHARLTELRRWFGESVVKPQFQRWCDSVGVVMPAGVKVTWNEGGDDMPTEDQAEWKAALDEAIRNMPPGKLVPGRPAEDVRVSLNPVPPYAIETTADGMSVRIEAPTLEGLLELERRWNQGGPAPQPAVVHAAGETT